MTDKTPSTGTEMTDEEIMSAPNVTDITDMTDEVADLLDELEPFAD